MTDYPKTAEERQRVRAHIKRVVMAEAERKAIQRGRSYKCGGDPLMICAPQHADRPGGCANDGSGCICECHDPAPGDAS